MSTQYILPKMIRGNCKNLYLLLVMLAGGFGSFAQPANDDPCAAAVLTAAATCTYQTFTTTGATTSTGFPDPGCAAFNGNDVWFQITVPAGGGFTIDTDEGGITDGGLALYSGDCNTMALISCNDDGSPNGAMSLITASGLTPGSIVYARFWAYDNDESGTFGICVTLPPPPITNDDPCAAITLTPSATCTYQTFSTVGATASAGFPDPGCAAYNGGDVWFSVVVPPGGAISIDTDDGGITDAGMALYSGNCNTLTLIECNDDGSPNGLMPMIIRSGLIPGSTVWIRIWEYDNDNAGTFGICVTIPPPPPANDNCGAATVLPVNTTNVCTLVTAGTTQSATSSTGIPATTCGGGGENDDVWYSFVAAGPLHKISLLNLTGVSTDMGMAVYSGASCAALTSLQCLEDDQLAVNGLVTGQAYFVRVWTTSTAGADYANFNICVSVPPPPPVNDEPCNAIILPVGENNLCNFQQFSNENATGSSVPDPDCSAYAGGDVWFKVVVPCTGNITFDSRQGEITDGGMAVYTGTCNNLTLLDCDDDGSTNGAMPKIILTGLTVGDTIWIRFFEYNNDDNGTFDICVASPANPILLPALPASPTCALAQPLCTSTTPYSIPNISGQDPTNAPGGGIYGCLNEIPNPTYYVLNIQTSGSIELTISQQDNSGNGVDVDFVVWGPFPNIAATCTGLSASNIVDCSFLPDPVEQINIPNAIAGQVYILLVTNYGNEAGIITYQQTGGTGSSSCCPVSATNSGGVYCQGPGSVVNLFSSTVPNANYIWTGPNCYTSNQQNPVGAPVPGTPGQYVYTVTAYTPTGQVCADTTIITVLPKPFIGADTTFKICAGTTANLTTIYNTATLAPVWTFNGNPVANPAAVNVTGSYRLVAGNSTGCADTAFVNLTVDTVRSEVSVAQIVCTQTGRITVSNLSGISPYQYSLNSPWNTGVFQSSNEFIAPAGTYTVITRDSLGCTGSNPVTVTIVPEVTVNAGPDVSIVTGETTQLQATVSAPPASILWTPPAGLNATNILDPKANPVATTTYTIAVTNSLGCEAEDDIIVTVIPYCIRVKNAFTPNGDGINDTWQVYEQYDCLKNVTVHIFNRYGNKIYESRDYRNLWQGTYNNKPIPDGTYYAVVDFTLITGKKITIKSDLTILR